MLNRVCCPEFSFNMSEDSPHALVAFLDGEKESVPLSFIQMFPQNWREDKWDLNYLFKVFWSPEEKDSPPEMLKRVAEIPLYGEGSGMEKPGYYRAAVIAVKDSLAELEKHVETKRPSIGLSKFKYTSFDKSTNPASRPSAQKSGSSKSRNTSRAPRPSSTHILKKKKPSSTVSKTKKGISLAAQTRNTADLKEDLQKRFPKLIKKPDCEENTDTGSASGNEGDTDDNNSGKIEESNGLLDVPNEDNAIANIDPANVMEVQFTVGSDEITMPEAKDNSHSSDSKLLQSPQASTSTSGLIDNYSLGKRKSGGKHFKPKRSTYSDDDSSSTADSKKIKLDPDFTPRKYEAAKLELALKKNSIKRLTELNMKLQEKIIVLERKNEMLEQEKEKLALKLSNISSKKNKSPATPPMDNSKMSTNRSDKKPPVRCLSFSGSKESKEVNIKIKKEAEEKTPTVVSKENNEKESKPNLNTTKNQAGPLIPDADLAPGDHEEDPGSGVQDEGGHSDDDMTKPLQLCANVTIPLELRKHIYNIPDGEKKDIKFMKELSLVAFGPEVLAASSIKGTKKGRGKDKEAKNALDPTILHAVRGKLLERVAKHLKISNEEAEEHARCTTIRFHGAIRDVQKKCRGMGYGNGTKENTVDSTLLLKTSAP